MRLFDLDGHPTRSIRLPSPVNPFGCCAAWSPDGQQLVFGDFFLGLRTGSLHEMFGGEVQQFASVVVRWYDDRDLLMLHLGTGGQQLQVLDVRTRRVVRQVNLNAPDWFASASALVPLPVRRRERRS